MEETIKLIITCSECRAKFEEIITQKEYDENDSKIIVCKLCGYEAKVVFREDDKKDELYRKYEL